MINGGLRDGIATDGVSGLQTRRSMQARRSIEPHRLSMGSYGRGGDREGLIHAYDEEEHTGFGLTDLPEDSEEDISTDAKLNGTANGKQSFSAHSSRRASPRPR